MTPLAGCAARLTGCGCSRAAALAARIVADRRPGRIRQGQRMRGVRFGRLPAGTVTVWLNMADRPPKSRLNVRIMPSQAVGSRENFLVGRCLGPKELSRAQDSSTSGCRGRWHWSRGGSCACSGTARRQDRGSGGSHPQGRRSGRHRHHRRGRRHRPTTSSRCRSRRTRTATTATFIRGLVAVPGVRGRRRQVDREPAGEPVQLDDVLRQRQGHHDRAQAVEVVGRRADHDPGLHFVYNLLKAELQRLAPVRAGPVPDRRDQA